MAGIKLKSKATLRSIQSSILTKGLLYNLTGPHGDLLLSAETDAD